MFPRILATRAKPHGQGVDEADFEELADKVERSANLQLLPGPENIQKRAQLPADWVRAQYSSEQARNAWLAGHDLHGLPADLVDLLPFYEKRRAIARENLAKLLGARPDEIREAATQMPTPPPPPAAEAMPPAEVATSRGRVGAHVQGGARFNAARPNSSTRPV